MRHLQRPNVVGHFDHRRWPQKRNRLHIHGEGHERRRDRTPSTSSNSVTPTTADTKPGPPRTVDAWSRQWSRQAVLVPTRLRRRLAHPVLYGFTLTDVRHLQRPNVVGHFDHRRWPQNGTAYTFTVRATNAAGTGPPSTSSNSVTPTSAPQRLNVQPTRVPPGTVIQISLSPPGRPRCPENYVFQGNVEIGNEITRSSHGVYPYVTIPGNAAPGQSTIRLTCTPSGIFFKTSSFDITSDSNHLTAFETSLPNPNQIILSPGAIVETAAIVSEDLRSHPDGGARLSGRNLQRCL